MQIYSFSQASIEHPERCEDALVIFDGQNGSTEQRAQVFAVIDGIGGQQHRTSGGSLITGHEAAELIHDVLVEDLEHLPVNLHADPGGMAEERLMAAIKRANQRVYHELNSSEALPVAHRVGAVLTVAVVCEEGNRLLVIQVGDTRAYLYSGGELIQLCSDEDNIELLVRRNGLSEVDAEKVSAIVNAYDGVHEPKVDGKITVGGQEFDLYMAWRWFVNGNPALNIFPANVVINALGQNGGDLTPEQSRIEVSEGDVLCLCSDGLYKNLTDDEIAVYLGRPGDVALALGKAAFARSADASNHRMNPDDISVIVVQF